MMVLLVTIPMFAAQCGDVNSSNSVDIVDALLIAKSYVGGSNLDQSIADVNGDSKIDIVDALLVAQFYVKIISEFSGCKPSSQQGGGQPISNCKGYATRFWDCCKPHCSWRGNVPAGVSPVKTCNKNNQSNGSNYDVRSCCDGGDGYVCYEFIPWAVNSNLSYGFAATSSGDVCGRCYELQFTGEGKHGTNAGATALKGKRMIVQAINIGYDVGGHQFDLLIPGGGVGAFNGCSNQWGISKNELGAQYGGFLTVCQQQNGWHNYEAIKNCVKEKINKLFRSKGLTQLAQGADWFVDWFKAADNPMLYFKEVRCPDALVQKSGMDRRPLNDIKNGCN